MFENKFCISLVIIALVICSICSLKFEMGCECGTMNKEMEKCERSMSLGERWDSINDGIENAWVWCKSPSGVPSNAWANDVFVIEV